MTTDMALGLVREMLWTGLMIGAPVIGASMVVGLIISVIQVVTQIQEMTLTFVPKLIVIFFVIVSGGGWMLGKMVTYSARLFTNIPALIH